MVLGCVFWWNWKEGISSDRYDLLLMADKILENFLNSFPSNNIHLYALLIVIETVRVASAQVFQPLEKSTYCQHITLYLSVTFFLVCTSHSL